MYLLSMGVNPDGRHGSANTSGRKISSAGDERFLAKNVPSWQSREIRGESGDWLFDYVVRAVRNGQRWLAWYKVHSGESSQGTNEMVKQQFRGG